MPSRKLKEKTIGGKKKKKKERIKSGTIKKSSIVIIELCQIISEREKSSTILSVLKVT